MICVFLQTFSGTGDIGGGADGKAAPAAALAAPRALQLLIELAFANNLS
jgi:hypothetical protein